jgi:hypothetical protein
MIDMVLSNKLMADININESPLLDADQGTGHKCLASNRAGTITQTY